MTQQQISPKSPGKLFIISAPSGGGKTTISEAVITRLGKLLNIQKVITYTSRAPRNNEVNGVDYFFITKEDFLAKKAVGFFLETTCYDSYYYGSPASIITDLTLGKSFILVTDRPGALLLKNIVPSAVLIWIYVSNPREIEQRLIKRSSPKLKDGDCAVIESITRRFILAQEETEQELRENVFRYHVANDVLETAIQQVCVIVQDELTCESSSR